MDTQPIEPLAYALASRAADGTRSYVSRRSAPGRLAGTADPDAAMAWGEREGGLAGLLAWVDARDGETRDRLRERSVAAVALPEGSAPDIPLDVPAPDFDAAWSPTADPPDLGMCRGEVKTHAAPRRRAPRPLLEAAAG